jgi:hypothetical protein
MNRFRLGFTVLALITSCAAANANDFEVSGIGGSWHPAAGENRSIQMVSERIRINISQGKDYYRYYDTTADFLFHNHGAATSVNMAFPENAGGGDPDEGGKPSSGFRSFQTTVNGKATKAKRVITRRSLKSGVKYQALWIKRVSFAAGERKAVRVSYRSIPGSLAGVGWLAAYDFTGGNWRGKVQESVLTVALHTQTTEPVRAFLAKQPVSTRRNKNVFTYRWTNWEANGPFRFWYGITRGQENSDHVFTSAGTPAGLMRSSTMPARPLAPDQIVRNLYAAQKAGRGPFFQTTNRALVDGEAGAIDFDPLYGSQDPQISNFTIMRTGWGGDKKFGPAHEAVVQAAFRDAGTPRMVSYQLRQGSDKVWKIYDIHYRVNGNHVRLTDTLSQAAVTP